MKRITALTLGLAVAGAQADAAIFAPGLQNPAAALPAPLTDGLGRVAQTTDQDEPKPAPCLPERTGTWQPLRATEKAACPNTGLPVVVEAKASHHQARGGPGSFPWIGGAAAGDLARDAPLGLGHGAR